nr:hypothetical protein [Lactiplantibacillus daowaiensis]
MEIKLSPAALPTPVAILSMQGLDNRELNPAIEKQLAERQLMPPAPQSALGDLMAVIGDRHQVPMQAWDAALLAPKAPVQLQVTQAELTLTTVDGTVVAPDLDSKSSQILVVIGAPTITEEVVHATGQDLQRKLKAFFGNQARLQYRTLAATPQVLNTIRPVS